MAIWFFSIFIVFLLTLTLLLRISFTLDYVYKYDDQVFTLACYVYKFQLFKKKKTFKIKIIYGNGYDELEQIQHNLRSVFDTFKELKQIADFLFERTKMSHLHWHTEIGTKEPNQTGLAVGGMWNLKSIIIRIINHNAYLVHNPVITIDPLFKKQYFRTTLTCILTMNLGKAIYILLKMRKNETINRVFKTTGGS